MESGKLEAAILSMKEDVGEIKSQVKITNGRVSSLENEKYFIRGGLAVLTLLVVPILLAVILKFI